MSENLEALSGVFYADGSCRPTNPGYIGWGFHGYFFKEQTVKPVVSEQFVHTLAGYHHNTVALAEHTAPVVPLEYVDGFGSDRHILSNNAAEVMGLYNLLVALKDKKMKSISVFTDSEYTKNSINQFCKRWEQTGWRKADGTEISNKEIIQKTYTLLKEIRQGGTQVSIEWIRGHTGHLGNDRADILAAIGSNHSRDGKYVTNFDFQPARGFWKSDADRSAYLPFRRLYFNSVRDYHRPGVYHVAEAPDVDFVVGKPSAPSCYSVIYLKEADPLIETLKEQQFQNSRTLNAIMLMKLDSVYSKQVYPWISKFGGMATMPAYKNAHSMQLVDKKPLTVEMNPTGLSMRALEYFAMLEDILNSYQDDSSEIMVGASKVTMYDITDKFFKKIEIQPQKNKKKFIEDNATTDAKIAGQPSPYEVWLSLGNTGSPEDFLASAAKDFKDYKFELLPEFIVGFKNLPMKIEYEHEGKTLEIKIPYQLGFDCLPRNQLKYLESENPKIELLTWVDGRILRYATIINSNIGIGIWSNYFANTILLPI